jgi:hypothetical protein
MTMDITTKTLAIVTIVKVLVDMTKMANPELKPWVPPFTSTVFGIITAVLLDLSAGVSINSQTLATSVLAGILAAGAAVGVTELQKRA